MKRQSLVTVRRTLPALLLLLIVCPGTGVRSASAAAMGDYCQVPPYVIQNVPPNVMLEIDISGSMFNFAYFDGFTTQTTSDDDMCDSSGSPCTGFTAPGTYPTYKYYGYFNPDYWYRYTSNRFLPTAPKFSSGLPGGQNKSDSVNNEWDGNFLNWLTMRRTDILRKVLTGGKTTSGEGSGYDRLVGEVADCDARGKYKLIANADLYTPWGGTRKFYVNSAGGSCNGSGSGTSSFSVRNDNGGGDGTGNAGSYNVAVRVPIPVEGVLQSVVGARARVGVTFYNTNDGGYVQVPIAASNLASAVNQINLTRPNANTPLGETLWTIVGDFAQQSSISGYNTPSGNGPLYHGGDYLTNSNNDPLNFGTGGSPRWPVCQNSFVLLITDGEPCSDGDFPSNLLTYASGKSAYDCSGGGCPAVDNSTALTGGVGNFSFPASTFPSCGAGGYTAGLEDVALFMHTNDLRNSPVIGIDNIARKQNLTLYTVFAFGTNSSLLKYAAINGGFEDSDGSGTPNLWDEWDANHDGVPDTYYEATDGARLEQAVKDAFSSILKRASSGTAASVLASGEGSGANLIQAVFYPRRRFGNVTIAWTGSLQNLWYYVDPFFANASIREETQVDNKLNLTNDYIAQFYFDAVEEVTKVHRWGDTNGDGAPDTVQANIGFEDLGNLWEAGSLLWQRDLSASPRSIYTSTGSGLIPFNVDNAALVPLANLQAADATEREHIIRFVNGEDIIQDLDADQVNDFRLRTVTLGIDNAVWKLGDIINSTPRIVAGIALNTYDKIYSDTTYANSTGTGFTDGVSYKNRGMVFAGGNDGMLHAFKLGKLELTWIGQTLPEKARLTNPDVTTPLGNEEWAFIPKNAQPYLKYMLDPDYCHLYYTDLSPYVFDASIGGNTTDVRTANSWRTVLVGGMRNGGACRNLGSSCNGGTSDCVKTPVSNLGFSSYFALEVTDPENPTLLWEFSNPALGFTTPGPAIVRVNALDNTGTLNRALNGRWYAVFASGPTGPIDNTSYQFMGRSDQNLRIFIVDLKTGTLVRTIDTGISQAFAGSMINSVADFNLDYQDDAIYIPYVKKDSGTGEWTQGGIGRLVTKAGITGFEGDPAYWEWHVVIDNIGPVTSAVARLQNNTYHVNWLFFGTGRFFFEVPPAGTNTTPTVDDGTGQRALFGVKDPCFTPLNTINTSCTSVVDNTTLTDVTNIANVPLDALANSSGFFGWKIDLEPSGNYVYDNTTRLYRSERVITDPLATTAGLVFFTTYKPYGDECALGGKSFLWAVRYNTGGAPSSATLKGKALVQVSTASVEQLDLSTAFTGMGGRRSFAIEGVPPTAQGLSLLSPPPPVKRLLHIRER
jgi:type IV pilus assembly protein PilY1